MMIDYIEFILVIIVTVILICNGLLIIFTNFFHEEFSVEFNRKFIRIVNCLFGMAFFGVMLLIAIKIFGE